MKAARFIGSPLFALAIGITGCFGCSAGTDGNGGSDDTGGSSGLGGQSGSGTSGGGSGSSGSGGQSGSGTSGGSSGGSSGSGGQSGSGTSGDSISSGTSGGGSGGMAGSEAATAGADAGGGAGSGIIDGSLDPTFGVDGIVFLDLEDLVMFDGVAIQPSGKILVVGVIGNQACIARYTREGTLDPSFGDTGLTLAELGNGFSNFSKVDQQSDGSLIAVGTLHDATRDMLVARFSEEGQLDRSFGTDGFTVIDAGGEGAATEFILLSDDTLLIGGWATPGATGTDFAVVHLDADGVPDPNFGSAGLAFAHYDQSDRGSSWSATVRVAS